MDPESAINRVPQELWEKLAHSLRIDVFCRHAYGWDPADCIQCHKIQLRNVQPLAQTNRFLHLIIQPLIYETVHLTFHSYPSQLSTSLAQQLLSPHYQNHIHRLFLNTMHLSSQKHLGVIQQNNLISTLGTSFLPLLCNLQQVTFYYCDITPSVAQLLRNCSNLCSVHLSDCWWSGEVPENWADGASWPKLTSLAIEARDWTLSKTTIAKYSPLYVPTLRDVDMDCNTEKLLSGLTPGVNVFDQITKLGIELKDVTTINHPLLLFPNVTHLTVHSVIGDNLILPPIILPRLNSLRGTYNSIHALSKGRQIESVIVSSGAHKTFHGLLHVYSTLRKLVLLHLKWSDDMILFLGRECRALEWLEVTFALDTEDLEGRIVMPPTAQFEGLSQLVVLGICNQPGVTDTNPLESAAIRQEKSFISELCHSTRRNLREALLSEDRLWAFREGSAKCLSHCRRW